MGRPRPTAYGDVAPILTGGGLEAVRVTKFREPIDPGWFIADSVDLLAVLQGRLRVEFAARGRPPEVLGPGDILVIPPRTRCRAYRWPRSARRATIFLAVYPVPRRGGPRRGRAAPRRSPRASAA